MPASTWQMGYPSFGQLYQPGTYGGIYGAPGGTNAFQDTPFGQQYLEDTPEAAFFRELTRQGFGGLDRRSATAQSLYSRLQSGYKASLADNPFMPFAAGKDPYLSRFSFADLLRGMTPQQRQEGLPNFNLSSRWEMR